MNAIESFYGGTEINSMSSFDSDSLSENEFIDFILENPSLKQHFIDLFKIND